MRQVDWAGPFVVKILLPHAIAKTCFLSEALLYRAVGRLPLASISDSDDEVDAPGAYPEIVLSPEECRVGRLQPDPEWEEREKRDGTRLLDELVLAPAGSDRRRKLQEQWIKWKAEKDRRQHMWNAELQELLERHHMELRTALYEERLRSRANGQIC